MLQPRPLRPGGCKSARPCRREFALRRTVSAHRRATSPAETHKSQVSRPLRWRRSRQRRHDSSVVPGPGPDLERSGSGSVPCAIAHRKLSRHQGAANIPFARRGPTRHLMSCRRRCGLSPNDDLDEAALTRAPSSRASQSRHFGMRPGAQSGAPRPRLRCSRKAESPSAVSVRPAHHFCRARMPHTGALNISNQHRRWASGSLSPGTGTSRRISPFRCRASARTPSAQGEGRRTASHGRPDRPGPARHPPSK